LPVRIESKLITADIVYNHLHGPEGPYQGTHGDPALRISAKRIRGWTRAGLCYFANDDRGCAPKTRCGCARCFG
jgi:uncharacterized protein YecE (DUF72 family)